MASLTTHTRKDGRASFYVKWYDRELKRDMSQPFRDETKARTLKLYLDVNQNTLSLARKAKKAADAHGTTVWDAIETHLSKLRDTETTRKYRRDMAQHVKGTSLAAIPLPELTSEDIAAWLDGLRVGRTKANPEGSQLPGRRRTTCTPSSPPP
ncbi:hypothetical protein [Nesterenkonia flava]|uniref:Core-binding (CB) domain-containing protein n=1 Tax=Nesterenkonia flava TaxID=469799 RepID=A0ABU1FVF8_9MICC|nr:hypothetical protein [Nesterenkonia flava]MDR5712322.1 hypothetical protein [Nesterenkonia flava]